MRNRLVGALPSEIGKLTNLRVLNLAVEHYYFLKNF